MLKFVHEIKQGVWFPIEIRTRRPWSRRPMHSFVVYLIFKKFRSESDRHFIAAVYACEQR